MAPAYALGPHGELPRSWVLSVHTQPYGHRLNDVSEVHAHEHVLMMLGGMPVDAVGWATVRWTGAGHGMWRQRLLPA